MEIFENQDAPLVSTTPAANFATGTAGVVDTGGKFATGVNDTGGTVPLRVTRPLSKYNNIKVWLLLFLTYPVRKGACPDTTCHCACQYRERVFSWTVQITHEQVERACNNEFPYTFNEKTIATGHWTTAFLCTVAGGKSGKVPGQKSSNGTVVKYQIRFREISLVFAVLEFGPLLWYSERQNIHILWNKKRI